MGGISVTIKSHSLLAFATFAQWNVRTGNLRDVNKIAQKIVRRRKKRQTVSQGSEPFIKFKMN